MVSASETDTPGNCAILLSILLIRRWAAAAPAPGAGWMQNVRASLNDRSN